MHTGSFVSIRNVSLVYGEAEEAILAVQDLSLEIEKGSSLPLSARAAAVNHRC
jgi:ABC-type dipeptide/oligopeptide/nickel transport system ATPase subunit